MEKKQKVKYLSLARWLVTLCFSSQAFATDSNELNFGEKDLKSFSPNLYGAFFNFTQKKDAHAKNSSLPCISILSEKFCSSLHQINKDDSPGSFDAEIIAWAQLPYKTVIEINLSLDPPLQSKECQFDKSSSTQSLAGFYSLPTTFKKRHLKNLPDLLVASLKQAADKELPYLEIIAAQNFYSPIPSIELVIAKISEDLIKKDPLILQHFDAFQEDTAFQKSLYTSLCSLEKIFVIPEKNSLIGLTQVPFFSSFSTDPLTLNTSYFAHDEQSILKVSFIPCMESSSIDYSSNYATISLDNQAFINTICVTSSKITPLLNLNPLPCHQNKLSSKEFVIATPEPEVFIAAMHPVFSIKAAKESGFVDLEPLKQSFATFHVPTNFAFLNPQMAEEIVSFCDFLAKQSLGDYKPKPSYILSLSKQGADYKKGITLSLDFSFDSIETPLHLLAASYDPTLSFQGAFFEKVDPLAIQPRSPWILSVKEDSSTPFVNFQSFYASIPYSPEANIEILNTDKIFFDEALYLSISPLDLDSTTSGIQIQLSLDLLASNLHTQQSNETLVSLFDQILFSPIQNIKSLFALESLEQTFFELPKYLDILALTLKDPEDLSKTLLDENIAIFEIHPSILDTHLPAEVYAFHDNFELPDLENHGLENSYLLSYQKSLRARLSDYSIVVDKLQEEDQIDPITTNKSLKILLAGSLQDNLPSRSLSITKLHAERQTSKNLDNIPSSQELCNYNATEDFIHDLHITPNPKGTGYLFSVTLLPQQQKLETNCPQNYIFLIDRSGSIDKIRFQSFKQGVMKSLLYLKDCDTFNIITFDTEMSKMSHESVFATQATKHGAKRYLENQKRGYQYGIPNIPQVLLSLQPVIQKSSLPTTIVLLTSGKTLENYNKELDEPLLKKQLKANKNSFTLFTAGCQDVSDSNMLEMISLLNRGEYMISQTNAAFPRKLAALVKHATYLAASNVHITTANRSQPVKVDLYPNSPIAPNLYGDKPYTIVGKIDKLADFDLVLQGRFCDNWILIKKKVSFSSARHGGHSILKDFKTFTAYNQYHEYFEEGSIAHLEEAKESLQSYKGHLIR